jgi:hypothetical protein
VNEAERLMLRAIARDREFEQSAIEASRDGDDGGVWMAMVASRRKCKIG